MVIIVVLISGGQQSDKDEVMAPDTYLLEVRRGNEVPRRRECFMRLLLLTS